MKTKNLNQDTIHFKIATYRVLYERSNKTASFAENVKLQEKSKMHFGLIVAN